MPKKSEYNDDFDGGLALDDRTDVDEDIEEPKMYRVIMHNDHYSTMDFVVEMLISVFHKSAAEATRLMLEVHQLGQSVCGVYTYDVAVTKIAQVHAAAKERGYPLKCSYEEA